MAGLATGGALRPLPRETIPWFHDSVPVNVHPGPCENAVGRSFSVVVWMGFGVAARAKRCPSLAEHLIPGVIPGGILDFCSIREKSEFLHSGEGAWHLLGCAGSCCALSKRFWAAKRTEQKKGFWRRWKLYMNTSARPAKFMMFKRAQPVEFHKLSLFRVNISYMHIHIWHLNFFFGEGKRFAPEQKKLFLFGLALWILREEMCPKKRPSLQEKSPSTSHILAGCSLPVVDQQHCDLGIL